nr:GtrA family protein [uncultured Cupriavidus sp.]
MQPERGPSATFIRFLIAGGIAAAVNVGSRIIYGCFMPYLHSVSAAYLTGMVTAFVLSRYLVFNGRHGKATHQFLAFALVNVAAIAQTLGFSWLFGVWLLPRFVADAAVAETAGHIIGVMVPVFTSYFGHKHFSFRPWAGQK